MKRPSTIISVFKLALSLVVVAVVGMAAQTHPAASPGKSGTRLITLGTRGGPIPTVGRAQSSNVLIVNGSPYVVDAGEAHCKWQPIRRRRR